MGDADAEQPALPVSVPPSGDLAPGQRRRLLLVAVGGVDALSAAFLAPRSSG
jgi:hypothetical protein